MNWESLREVHNYVRWGEVDSKIESAGKNCCMYQFEYLKQNFWIYYIWEFHRWFRTEHYKGTRGFKKCLIFSLLRLLYPFFIHDFKKRHQNLKYAVYIRHVQYIFCSNSIPCWKCIISFSPIIQLDLLWQSLIKKKL